jgi:hypothetical protein
MSRPCHLGFTIDKELCLLVRLLPSQFILKRVSVRRLMYGQQRALSTEYGIIGERSLFEYFDSQER